MSICIICGDKFASSKIGLEAHNRRFHGGISSGEFVRLESRAKALFGEANDGSTGKRGCGKVVPMQISFRSMQEITLDFHKMLGDAVFPVMKPWHSVMNMEGYF